STGVDNFGCAAVTTTLTDHDDWANILFAGLIDGDALLPSPREIVDCENPTLPKVVPGRE
ncbi:MAG: hypothetical protein NDJ94_24460, partial [Vicinamibacteria bacterium]|nr:hypothetical protein [Vicinamibacteria bacterium]